MNVYTLMIGTGVLALALSSTVSSAGSTSVEPAQIAAAKTAADHEAIAKAYEDEATEFDHNAEMHERRTEIYKGAGKPAFAGQAKHCDALTNDLKAAANESRALATGHHKLAKAAGK